MGLNQTPNAERVHIGIFGRRNAGKSSVINAMTGQNLSIVSDVKGTTTDPVSKAMELLPLGPVVMIDTPGIDDIGELGEQRVKKSYEVLNKSDIGVLVVDGVDGIAPEDEALLEKMKQKKIPYLVVMNKLDKVSFPKETMEDGPNKIWVSAQTGEHIYELKERIAGLLKEETEKCLVADLLEPSDLVVLVVPIDKSAPKGRLILPQQQTIRDILDADATAVVVKEHQLKETLDGFLKRPKLVITDSQVFKKVAMDTPEDILLTSFSILFARYKGNLLEAVKGAKALDLVKDEDTILIAEGCTHHRQCEDIGTVKLPHMIKEYTNKKIKFEFMSGTQFPENLTKFRMIVHCGACTLNEREMKYRIKCAVDQMVPITNYGILIAYMQGILRRSVEVFDEIVKTLD